MITSDEDDNSYHDGIEENIKPARRNFIVIIIAFIPVILIFFLASSILSNRPTYKLNKSLFKRGEIMEALYLGNADKIKNKIGLMLYSRGMLETIDAHTRMSGDPRCRNMVHAMEAEGLFIGAILTGLVGSIEVIMKGGPDMADVMSATSITIMHTHGADDARTLMDPQGPFGCDSEVTHRVLAGIRGENAAGTHD